MNRCVTSVKMLGRHVPNLQENLMLRRHLPSKCHDVYREIREIRGQQVL